MQQLKEGYYPIYESGFRTKTINIVTSAGGTKFPLQQNNDLGLPSDANILAVWARASDATTVSSSNNLQVSLAVQNTAYLSLKDRCNKWNNISLLTSNYYIPELTNFAFFMQPVPSLFVDWNQSFIEVSGAVAASANTVFELVVLYTEKCDTEEFKNRFAFRNGTQQPGVRITSFEIPLNATQTQYSLGNTTNIGLESDAIVLGFRTKQNGFPLSKDIPMDAAAFRSTYLSLKKGTDSIIDEFPVAMTNYSQVIEEYNYFPIQPTVVSQMDWKQSKIDIKNSAGMTNGMTFQFDLIWYSQQI